MIDFKTIISKMYIAMKNKAYISKHLVKNKITDKIINIQDTLNDLLLGDHYRVFLRK